ncbi:hypothetical protein AK812_SmicGene10266 [Symbiodinium microadriaticum]|uniref:Uncharacterized protein n=1 Tax=Symbiodinium microadriaticum TaxID=2951 RepID=A0A1Q9EG47_SYMMI|nr:hypothetical protein AK812_SmicGene10266 [Symbiodinium microadriaticum]
MPRSLTMPGIAEEDQQPEDSKEVKKVRNATGQHFAILQGIPLVGPREERRGRRRVQDFKRRQMRQLGTGEGGFRNFLSDVLFGDDDDEEEDVEERADADAEGVIGTLALIGISAMAVSPAAGDEPLEGSFETHHIAIFAPLAAVKVPRGNESSAALRWGTALARSPLEATES